MDANATVERGLRAARGSPGAAVVWTVAAVLFLDLLAKLAGVSLGPFATPWFALWFGGDVAISEAAGLAWSGIVIGAVIGLASIGLSLTYSILNFANFAHGDYLTAGAFSGWAVTYVIAGVGGLLALGETALNAVTGLGQSHLGDADLVSLVLLRTPPLDAGANIWLSPLAIVVGLVVAVAMTVAVALALDRFVYRPMRDADGISLLIASTEIEHINHTGGPLSAFVVDAVPAGILLFAGYWLHAADVGADARWLVAAWSMAGSALFTTVTVLTIAIREFEGRRVVEPAFPMLVDAGVGAVAGFVAGAFYVRARRDADRAARAGDAFAFVNDVLRHDIRNSLGVIRGQAELLAATSDDDAVQSRAETIHE